jgi:hypothetical protein
MPFTIVYNNDTKCHGSLSHFIFKSVHPFVLRSVTVPKLYRWQLRRCFWEDLLKVFSCFRIFGYEAYPQHLRTRRCAQFIVCLSGGVQFGRIALVVERGTESLARWFVAFTMADPPATSQDYGAVYGDSPRCDKVSRHVAWLDNGERRWCQRDWPRRDTTAGENSGRSLSTARYFLPRSAICVRLGVNRDAGVDLGARSPAARGVNLQSLSITVQWNPYSVRLTAQFAGPRSQIFTRQLANLHVTKLLPDDPATILL